MFAFVLASLIAAAGEPAYLASCPAAEETRVLATSTPIARDNIHPTNRRVRLYIDVGSDGRVRHVAMVESSGDAVFDAAALEAAGRFRFAPQTQACISTSTFVPETFDVPLISLARPVPGSTSGALALPSTLPQSAVAICSTPVVELKGLDIPDSRQAPGTAAVDVGLDAAAHVTSVKLATSSGNAKTDATATEEARGAQYAFTPLPGCQPKPAVYRLELTFH
jgi:TonB family protein